MLLVGMISSIIRIYLHKIIMQNYLLEKLVAQPIPSTSPYHKYIQNPFRVEHPNLFSASPAKQATNKARQFIAPFGDCIPCIDPIAKYIEVCTSLLYQPLITPEILINFKHMVSMLPVNLSELDFMEVTLPTTSKGCLALDLDETLIHSLGSSDDYEKLGLVPSEIATIVYENKSGLEYMIDFVLRPSVLKFLSQLSKAYQIIVNLQNITLQVFTASSKKYAEKMVEVLDPDGTTITSVLSRKSCISRGQVRLKDLRLLKGKKMERTIIVDNTIAAFSGQLENGIYIPSFYGNKNDCELGKVADFLLGIAEAEDFRPHVASFAGIVKLYKEYSKGHNQLAMLLIQLLLYSGVHYEEC
eukprot:TRINITY_DN1281_c0_g1_i1.p1 TRINITY_DN1281_c0_g1~~TRINITY_DN1281_c0_g1_i1.p1  ORF type:complete len:357 (-),score=8.60 TRINITY_DN1281_c0_g1_i1:222-1292(-)